jgi:hypothetical protein
MSPIVTVVGGESPQVDVSISLEHTQLILADLRGALPELERQLRKKWPTLVRVRIEDVVPHHRNPIDAASAREFAAQLASAGLHLVAVFSAIAAARAGAAFAKEAIAPPSKEVGKFLRQWVQRFTKTKREHKTPRKRTTKPRLHARVTPKDRNKKPHARRPQLS